MRLGARFCDRPLVAQNTSASGATGVVTLAASQDQSHCLEAIHVTYNGGTPGTKAITVDFWQNGVEITMVIGVAATVSVTSIVLLEGRIVGDVNTAIIVTTALLASNTNTLEVLYN